jgi:hypothetical protein
LLVGMRLAPKALGLLEGAPCGSPVFRSTLQG